MSAQRRWQIFLAVLAVAGTGLITVLSPNIATDDISVLLVCAGVIALCMRFPLWAGQAEFSLAPALSISLVFGVGLSHAAWTTLAGLLLGEAWNYLSPSQPPTAERPPRWRGWAARLAHEQIALVGAGLLSVWLTGAAWASEQAVFGLGVFGLCYLLIFNSLIALETRDQPGAAAGFFRENYSALLLVELLPLPLAVLTTVIAAHLPLELGESLLLVVAAVVGLVAIYQSRTTWNLQRGAAELAASRAATAQTQLQVDDARHQITLAAAKWELAQHEVLSTQRRLRALVTLTRLDEFLPEIIANAPPYEALLRLLGETTEAHILQLGLLLRGGSGLSYVASFGLGPERAALERATVWLDNQGLPGRALRLGRPVRSGNAPTDPDYIEQFPGVRSELCAPLVIGPRRLGVLRLLSRLPDAFDEHDEAAMAQAASWLALALDNARLTEETRAREKENAILLEASVRLAANLDIRTVYRAIVQRLSETVGVSGTILFELEASRDKLRQAEPRADLNYPLAELPAFDHALRAGQAMVLPPAASLAPAEQSLLALHTAAGAAVVPMTVGTQPMGLALLTTQQTREFSSADLAIAQMLANQSAVALQNARLFHHVTEGRDRLAAILDSTREGVLVIDANGLVSLINPPLEEFWGLSSQELLGQPLLALVDQPELGVADKLGLRRDEIEELLLTLRAGLALSIPKHQFPIHAPRSRYLERTGAPVLDQFAKAIGWVVILRDVTEERELQHVRDTLANMIVHDLRSPLTSVLAGLSLIRDRLPKEQQTPLIKQSVEVAVRSSNKMLGLVNTLLDISRMETGEMALNRAGQTLSPIVDEIVADLMPLATDHGLVLINEVPADLPPVSADREKLSRVLTNLVDNALKFSPPGGQVIVRASAEAEQVLCTVLDSGPGIPPDYATRIFDRFVQVEGQTGRRSGTGLGLAFCKLAVEAHGGRIWVQNRPEGGSVFSLTLPRER